VNQKSKVRARRLAAVVGAPAVAVLLMGASALASGTAAKASGNLRAAKPAGLAALTFASTVNSAGTDRFADSYAGQVRNSAGNLVVYVTRSRASAFASEMQHLARAQGISGGYTLVTVNHSWAQLAAMTDRITAEMKSLQAQGVELAQWGPDPQSNKVQITLESYSDHAAQTLTNSFGAQWISVSHSAERWVFTDPRPAKPLVDGETRFTDTAPFYGGDIQWYGSQSSSVACTSGFSFVGKNSGNNFGLASGHCVSDAGGKSGTVVHTNTSSTKTVGKISTQYFPSTKIDIASVNTGGFAPLVYGNGTATYGVVGQDFPTQGDQLTADGRVSGEVRGVTVENTDNTINVSGFPIKDLTVASKPGATVCQGGDSGGPWYVHLGATDGVDAAGTQVGEREDPDGQLDPSVCVYEQIGAILSLVNGTLLTS
jgi:hypothetical protein